MWDIREVRETEASVRALDYIACVGDHCKAPVLPLSDKGTLEVVG